MTTTRVDDRQRVRIPDAKPGQVFSIEPEPNGAIRLVPVIRDDKPNKARLVKGPRGYFLLAAERPITQEQVRAALDEFP